MKLDIGLCRDILLFTEEHYPDPRRVAPDIDTLTEKGYTKEAICYHTIILEEENLVTGHKHKTILEDNVCVYYIDIERLTSYGHQYLGSLKVEEAWDKTEEAVKSGKLANTLRAVGLFAERAGAVIVEGTVNALKG